MNTSGYADLKNQSIIDSDVLVVNSLILPNLDPNSVPYIDSSNNVQDRVLTDGQLLIGSSGNAPSGASITGTANQIYVFNGPSSITLTTPQDIDTSSDPIFHDLTVTHINSKVGNNLVTGPTSATANDLCSFSGTTGRIIADSGVLGSNIFLRDGTRTATGNFDMNNKELQNVKQIKPFDTNFLCGNTLTSALGGIGNIQIGDFSTTNSNYGICLGLQNISRGTGSIAIGKETIAGGTSATVVGYRSSTGINTDSVVIGHDNVSGGTSADVFGINQTNSISNSLLLGNGSYVNIRGNSTCDLGTSSVPFQSLYLGGSVTGSVNTRTCDNIVSNSAGLTTANQVATYSDTSGKIITNSSTPNLGTPSALVLTNATGTPASLGLTNATGTPASLGLANATGTPSSIGLTNGTGLPLTTGVTGILPLANGGTSSNLTASNGGIFYSTGSVGAILAGTATAGQLLRSGSSAAPTWTTTTYPSTNVINTLLYASAANVMSALATANSSVLVTSSGGVPSLSTALPASLTATNMVLTTPNIGRPSNGDLSLCSSLPLSSITGLGASVGTALASFSSANIAAACTNETGTAGNLVFSGSPTITTPTINQANLVGVTDGSNASAGSVGEFLESDISSASGISSGVTTNITSLSVTAGDWDIFGGIFIFPTGTCQGVNGATSTTSATNPSGTNHGAYFILNNQAFTTTQGFPIGMRRYSFASTTTVYLVVTATFSTGTCTAMGNISARRRR